MGTQQLATVERERIDWRVAHGELSRLARERAAADAEEGRWLLAAQRSAAHVHLGYGCFSQYIERLFGYKPRSTQEKLRVAEALEQLPAFAQALSSGELSWSAVRELTRVAVRETEHEWLQLARGKTLRQLEEMLAGRHPGDRPGSPPDLTALRHVLRFEVAAETFALFRDALNELRRRAGAELDDDAALLELARQVLGGPRDEGRASYQISLSLCPECGAGRQQATGGLVPVGPEVTRMAHCDAQHLGPIADQRAQPANDFQPHESDAEHEVTSEWASVVENDTPPVDADPVQHHSAHAGVRAQQSIPPALRRTVLVRDQRRCQVPGCRNARFLDLHHLELRSEGGRHSLDNIVCLCGAHHRAVHRGALVLDRSKTGALRARHADGSEYGGAVRPQVLETRAKVFSALRHLGFREGEVRAALERLHGERGSKPASFDELLREALAQLRRPGGAGG